MIWIPVAPLVLLAATALALQAGGQPRAGGERHPARAVVVHADVEGQLRVTLSTNTATNVRYVELAAPAMRAFPTIDITCDGKLRTFPLTRSDETGNLTVALYEVLRDAVDAMLSAAECRLFLPGHAIALPRDPRWAAWADPSKGTEGPKVLVARVVEVVDGDTIKIDVADRSETVRYIGINTSEANHPSRSAEGSGRAAVAINRALVAGRRVRLELDVQERDHSGRLLAYVWVGDTMVNAELIRRGYAQAMTAPPNVRYQELFVKLQRAAREQKRGLWVTPSDATAPAPPPVAQTGPGVSPQDAWTCPATHSIKGNFTTSSGERCIYHVPGGEFYGRTKPERCYATEDQARQDGCRRSKL